MKVFSCRLSKKWKLNRGIMKNILRSLWELIRMGIKVKVILEHDLKFELLLQNIFNILVFYLLLL